jgi:hypothetical protein
VSWYIDQTRQHIGKMDNKKMDEISVLEADIAASAIGSWSVAGNSTVMLSTMRTVTVEN